MILRFNVSSDADGTAMLSVRAGVVIVSIFVIAHSGDKVAESNYFLELPRDTWKGPLSQEQLGEDACRICIARFLAERATVTSAVELTYHEDQPRWGGRLTVDEKR